MPSNSLLGNIVIDRRKFCQVSARGSSVKSTEEQQSSEASKSVGPNSQFSEWFVRWRKPIRKWLSRRASVPTAELDDLAQEVFLRLLRYSEKTAVENPLGYLLRIASNIASERRERTLVSKPHNQSWLNELLIEPEEEPENSLCRAGTTERVHQAVNALPRRQREVLLLRVNEGLSYKQLAECTGLTQRSVSRDLSRAYSQLRMKLDLDDLK